MRAPGSAGIVPSSPAWVPPSTTWPRACRSTRPRSTARWRRCGRATSGFASSRRTAGTCCGSGIVAPPGLEYLSPAFSEIWGRGPEEVVAHGVDFLTTLHPDDRERVAAALSRGTGRRACRHHLPGAAPRRGTSAGSRQPLRDPRRERSDHSRRRHLPGHHRVEAGTGRAGARAEPPGPRAAAARGEPPGEQQPPGDHQPDAAAGRAHRQRGGARGVRGSLRARQHDHRAACRPVRRRRDRRRSTSAPTCTTLCRRLETHRGRCRHRPDQDPGRRRARPDRPRPRGAAGPDRQRAGHQRDAPRRRRRTRRHGPGRSSTATTITIVSACATTRPVGQRRRGLRPCACS